MKLLFCEWCQDVFKLKLEEMRSCDCGRVKGRYINNSEAEVSFNAISIGIGNGSLISAIADMKALKEHSNDKASREEYYSKFGGAKIEYAWVRPNTGPGNPHTKLIEPIHLTGDFA